MRRTPDRKGLVEFHAHVDILQRLRERRALAAHRHGNHSVLSVGNQTDGSVHTGITSLDSDIRRDGHADVCEHLCGSCALRLHHGILKGNLGGILACGTEKDP